MNQHLRKVINYHLDHRVASRDWKTSNKIEGQVRPWTKGYRNRVEEVCWWCPRVLVLGIQFTIQRTYSLPDPALSPQHGQSILSGHAGWERTAPAPRSEVSISIRKGTLGSVKRSTGAAGRYHFSSF